MRWYVSIGMLLVMGVMAGDVAVNAAPQAPPLMAQANDSIVVIGEALLQIPENILTAFSHIYCLSNEQNLLNDSVKDRMSIIEYSQFADLVLQFERSISLK